jgi:preprotein translocase subunit SecA
MAQMLEQFTDEKQKSFFADFLDFAKEQNALDKNNANQQQMMQQLGDIEKKWMRTPREKLGGLTPEEYKEQNPDVEKSTVQTYRRESPKVGRNDPCPCGSGKKYKKCHGK